MVSDLFLKKEGDKVVIEGLSVEEGKKINSWKASFLGSDHLLLAKEAVPPCESGTCHGNLSSLSVA